MTDLQADKYSVMLGFHPSEVFGMQWWETVEYDDDEESVELMEAS